MAKFRIGKYRPDDGHITESNAWNSFAYLAEMLIVLDIIPYIDVGKASPHRMYLLWVDCQHWDEDIADRLKLD